MPAALIDPEKTPWVPTEHAIHLAYEYFIICNVLMSLATLLLIARVLTRFVSGFRLAVDDYLSIIAFAFAMTHSAFFLVSIKSLDNELDLNYTKLEESHFYSTISQPFWAWAMAATKCSIAMMLLRLEQQEKWRRFLWGMIAFQILLAIYNMLTQLLQCVPLDAAWNLHENVVGKCWSPTAFKASSVTVQMLNVVTDWIFALLPISFLRKVQRPLRERVIIGLLMALGVFAGAASLVKIHPIIRLGYQGDYSVEHMRIGMWSCIEELLAFSCACVPCLRAPFQRALEYLGIASSNPNSQYGRTYGHMYGNGTEVGAAGAKSKKLGSQSNGGLGSVLRMTTVRNTDGQSEEHILTGAGEGAGSNEIWCTREVRVEEDSVKSEGMGRPEHITDANWLSVDITDMRGKSPS